MSKDTLQQRATKFLNDVATLDVLTLTGDITLKPAAEAPAADKKEDVLNWDNLFAEITKQMKAEKDSTLQVVAYTHAEWDCDAVNYVMKDPTDAQKDLIKAHNEAVAAAHNSRYQALQFIAKIVT